MIISKISLNIYQKPMEEMDQLRKKKFWSTNLLSQFDKGTVKYYMFLQYLLWFFSLLTIIFIAITPVSHPEFMCRSYWPWYIQLLYKIMFLLYSIFGYYIGNVSVAYYTYVVLHSHFQIKMIYPYITQQLGNISAKEKFYSKSYQQGAREVLVRCIRHYHTIRRLRSKIC